jgi:hypothetical protein
MHRYVVQYWAAGVIKFTLRLTKGRKGKEHGNLQTRPHLVD